MNIALNKLSIENGKGIKNFDEDFGGKDAEISGENGTGKTTVFDMFKWILNFTTVKVRPLDKDNNLITGLVVAAEAELAYDGQVHVFRKEEHERVVKNQTKGYTAKYWIDEVPKSQSDYNDYIAKNLIPEDTFKILTDLTHFNGKLHWEEQRKVLIDIAGDIGTPKGFDELLAALNGRDIKDYKKVLTEQKKKHKDTRDEIGPRIDEIQKGLEQYAELGEDVINYEQGRDKTQAEIDKLDADRETLFNSQQMRQKRVEAFDALKSKKIQREAELQNDTSGVKKFIDEKAQIEADYSACESAVTQAEVTISGKERLIENDANINLANCLRNINDIREEYNKIKDKKEESKKDEVCYACGQQLLGEHLELAKTVKAAKLKEITERGAKARAMLTGCKDRIERLKADLNVAKEVLVEVKEKLAVIHKHRANRFVELDEGIKANKPAPFEQDKPWLAICRLIEKVEAEIGEPLADQMQQIHTARNEKTKELELISEALLNADNIKKSRERIAELEDKEKDLAQKIADLEKQLADIDQYEADESKLIESAVNGKFKHVEFKLFNQLLNEGLKPCCEALLDGTPYSGMSGGEKMFVGIDIINVLSEHYGVSVCLFVDNAESLSLPVETDTQTIKLFMKPGVKKLVVEKERELAKAY